MNIKEKILMSSIFGSKLYGTDNEESDTDLIGVFLPFKRDVLLQRVSHQYSIKREKKEGEKNTSEDVDIKVFSLYEFIKLACEGQTMALDMLHIPRELLYETSDIWDEIVKNRSKFYTKNLQAFVGYARRQAAKYGVKGSRLDAAKGFYELLLKYKSVGNVYDLKLRDIWNYIEPGEHIYFLENNANGIEQVQVCGKIFQATSSISYVIPIIEKFYETYGERAKKAAKNEGIDWKAISHAVRAAFELKELLTEHTITFPLKEAKLVKNIKEGMMDYVTEASPLLEGLMDEIEILSAESNLQEKVDREFWDNFVLDVIERKVL